MGVSIADYLLELKIGGVWTAVADSAVLRIGGSWKISGNAANALAFGDDTDATISGQLLYSLWSSLSYQQPIRYTTYNSGDTTARTFTGVITKLHRTLDTCDLEAAGMKTLIAATKIYSPMVVRRPAATKTSASSVEDPTNPAYAGGLINYAMWQCGGRPAEQAGSYPAATFYYSCDHALIAPDYAWLAGEDTWAECLKLAQASGGQLYQDASGVVRYRQVLGYAGATATDAIGNSDYASAEETTEPGVQHGTKFTCQYTPRRRLGTQTIADDTTPRHIEPGESVTIVIEPQNPIVRLETASGGTQLLPAALVVACQDGTRINQGAGGYTHTLDVKAGRIIITVTNAGSLACTVWRVTLRGDPVVAGESGSISAGSGTIERQIEPSVYIQRQSDAGRLAEMYAMFYGTARPTVTVRGCAHTPSRAVGQTILFSNAAWGISSVPYVILEIRHDDTGLTAEYALAYVGDLPDMSQFYVVGQAYSSGDTKYLGW
ncbi:MAG TPA: hypothetical protein PKK15_05910 [Kouleothrix sp.]|nr:hypothetical protein [Kouleothrix sp.]